MSDKLDPSARDFLASALEDAPRLDDGARRRMRENVLTTIGAGVGVVAIATAAKSAASAATTSIPAGAASTSIPAAAATTAAATSTGAAATTAATVATTATKVATLSLFAKAAIAVGVGGLVTTAAVWQASKDEPLPPPAPVPVVVSTTTSAPPTAAPAPLPTETAAVVEEKTVETKTVAPEPVKAAKVVVAPAPEPPPDSKAAVAPAPTPASTDFSKELDALDRARAALGGGDPAKALAVLDEGGSQSAAFVEERQALRIVALCSAGRGEEGRAALATFRSQFPRSLQTARVTRACEARQP